VEENVLDVGAEADAHRVAVSSVKVRVEAEQIAAHTRQLVEAEEQFGRAGWLSSRHRRAKSITSELRD
jgi:hypothetical protein